MDVKEADQEALNVSSSPHLFKEALMTWNRLCRLLSQVGYQKQKFSLSTVSSVRPRGAELYFAERLAVLAPALNSISVVDTVDPMSQTTVG